MATNNSRPLYLLPGHFLTEAEENLEKRHELKARGIDLEMVAGLGIKPPGSATPRSAIMK
jgi:hypothetical protein